MAKHSINKREELIEGLELSYKRLIAYKIERNSKIIISKNGNVIHADPKEFQK
mgnify:FL=1